MHIEHYNRRPKHVSLWKDNIGPNITVRDKMERPMGIREKLTQNMKQILYQFTTEGKLEHFSADEWK
jgi:hypothetical protein